MRKILKLKIKFKKRLKGFTLIETIIYSTILIISLGLISNFFYVSLKANQRNQIENELISQMSRIEEILRLKISSAKKINSVSQNEINLEMEESSLSPTVFLWSEDTLFFKEGAGSFVPLNDKNKIKVINFFPRNVSPREGVNISSEYHYAFNDLVGWIDSSNLFAPVEEGDLYGSLKILSDESLIYLNCLDLNICDQSNFKVERLSNGDLFGYAWSENYGWISFNCQTDSSCGASLYKVYIDEDGIFHGYAWSENIGWISFNCENGGENGENICETSDYKVQIAFPNNPVIMINLTLKYNSPRPDLAIEKSKNFIVQLFNPKE